MVAHRFFFALLPLPEKRAEIGAIRAGLGDLTSEVADDRLHMTLWISADHDSVPNRLVDRMMAVGRSIDAPPASVTLDRLVAAGSSVALRPRRNTRALRALGRQLDRRLVTTGARRNLWSFGPHVTLGYRRGAPFARDVAAVAWEATDVVLIHSFVGETRHVVLGRWPLTVRQGELFD